MTNQITRLKSALAAVEKLYETQPSHLTEREIAEREFFRAAAAAIEALQPVTGDSQ
jgi:hypothetical protein